MVLSTTNHTLIAQLALTAERFPNKVALRVGIGGQECGLTYAELLTSIKQHAELMVTLGVAKGDRVLLMLENNLEWPLIYFAVLLVGAIAVPIDPKSSVADVNYFVENSACKLIVIEAKLTKIFTKASQYDCVRQIITVGENTESELPKMLTYAKFLALPLASQTTLPELSPDDIASLVYTSGTTGKPKGVTLSHNNFVSNYLSVVELNIFDYEHNVLALLPFHHTFPFMVTLIIPLLTGASVTLVPSLHSENILLTLKQANITALVGVPELYYMFANALKTKITARPFYQRWLFFLLLQLNWLTRHFFKLNLGKIFFKSLHERFGEALRYMVCGGAHIEAKTVKFFLALGFTFLEGYGLTETAPIVTFNPPERLKLGSVGKAVPGVSIKILDPDQDGIGEVLIKGPNVMQGYWHREDATHEALRDGWFYSGDLGRLDKQGYVYLLGRKNELIVLANGKNINPEAVEEHYLKSEYIKELCVLKVGKGDQEKLMAVIVPNMEYFLGREEITLEGQIRWDVENFAVELPSYQRILGFVITLNPLPRTRLGKLRRFLIAQEFIQKLIQGGEAKGTDEVAAAAAAESLTDADLALLNNELANPILQVVQHNVAIKKSLKLTDHLELDLGLDSLKRMEIFAALEKLLDIKISEQKMAQIFTVRDVVQKLLDMKRELGGEVKGSEFNKEPLWQQVLQTPPPQDLLQKVACEPGLLFKLVVVAVDAVLWFLSKIFFRLQVVIEEPLPKERAFILCANHSSYLDGILLRAAVPWAFKQRMFYFIQRALVRNIIAKSFKLMHIIPISSLTALLDAFKVAAEILRQKKVLVVFPEGARSIDGKLTDFRNGIGILTKELKVPIMPVYIAGTFKAWPRTKKIPLPNPTKVHITFGQLQDPKNLLEAGKKLGITDDYAAITAALQQILSKYESLRDK